MICWFHISHDLPIFHGETTNLDGETHHDPFPSASHSTKSFESHRNHIELLFLKHFPSIFLAFSWHLPWTLQGSAWNLPNFDHRPRRCGHGWLRLRRYGGTTAARQGSRLVDRLDVWYLYIYHIHWLVVDLITPLKNVSSSMGRTTLSHILWKIKMFETTNQHIYIYMYIYVYIYVCLIICVCDHP